MVFLIETLEPYLNCMENTDSRYMQGGIAESRDQGRETSGDAQALEDGIDERRGYVYSLLTRGCDRSYSFFFQLGRQGTNIARLTMNSNVCAWMRDVDERHNPSLKVYDSRRTMGWRRT